MVAKVSQAEAGEGQGDAGPGEGRKYLVFREGPAVLALRIEAVRRVYDAQSGFPPRTPRTRMLDLVELLAVKAVSHDYWIEMEVGDSRYLMPVEQVMGINELSLAVTVPYPSVLKRDDNRYIQQLFFDGQRMIADVDCHALAAMTESKFGPGRRGIAAMAPRPTPDPPGPPRADAAKSDGRVLVFQGAGRTWALELGRVVQVVSREEVQYLPCAGKRVLGAIYYAEQAVPVVSPATLALVLAGGSGQETGPFGMIILTETDKGLLGLGCDGIVRAVERGALAQESEDGHRLAVLEIEMKTLLAGLV
jgi:chemotaxis signal transduction protein